MILVYKYSVNLPFSCAFRRQTTNNMMGASPMIASKFCTITTGRSYGNNWKSLECHQNKGFTLPFRCVNQLYPYTKLSSTKIWCDDYCLMSTLRTIRGDTLTIQRNTNSVRLPFGAISSICVLR